MNTIDVRFKGRKTSPDVLYMGVQMDNNVEAARFILPPELDGATVELHLRYEDQADTIILKDDRTWVLTRKHTQYPGLWTGWIKASRTSDDMTWHADPFSIQINSTPDPDGEEIPEKYPSAVDDAMKAAASLINADVSAQTLPAGSAATAEMTQDAEGNITIVYGIPQGEPGKPGYTPQEGVDYYGKEATERLIDEKLSDIPGGGGGDASKQIDAHNTDPDAHGDIRSLIEGKQPKGDYPLRSELPDVNGSLAAHNTAEDAHSDIRALVDDKQPKGDYALKTELPTVPTNVSAFQNDAGYLTQHQDLSGYALKSEIPDVSGQISKHNTATDAHGDIRLSLVELAERLNALANSDDTTLDQMAEVVAYIKDNRDLIEQVTTNKVNVTDIVDNITTNVANKPLSAAQGVTLKGLIDALNTALGGKQPAGDYATREELPKVPTNVSVFENDAGYAKKSELPTVPTNVSAFTNDANYVPRATVDAMIKEAIKTLAPQKIEFSQGKLYAPATSASYSATSVSDNSITFAYRGGSGVEELMYPITGLYKGRTYTIVFDETYNGNFIQDTYRYGCGVIQEAEFASGTWPSNKSIPSWVVWHTGSKGTQSGSVTFTAQSSMVYWAWSLGRLSDGANVSITFNARVI